MPRNIEEEAGAEGRRGRSMLQGFRSTMLAVVVGVAMFIATYVVLDLGSSSKQERSKLFEFTIAAPALLEVCAEQPYGDPAEFREAARVASGLLKEARERSAEGLITVPRGSTTAAELARVLPELTTAARAQLADPARDPSQVRGACTELLNEFRSEASGWAHLQKAFPLQVRELGLRRPGAR